VLSRFGERIAFMHPTDPPAYDAMSQVAIAAYKRVGLNIDVQTTDWSTVTQRRNSKEPLERGGWSVFPSGFPAVDFGNPVLATGLRTTASRLRPLAGDVVTIIWAAQFLCTKSGA